jgi:hypothetical protein
LLQQRRYHSRFYALDKSFCYFRGLQFVLASALIAKAAAAFDFHKCAGEHVHTYVEVAAYDGQEELGSCAGVADAAVTRLKAADVD